MATKLVYKRVRYTDNSPEWDQFNEGTYQPPEGWRVHSMTITESHTSYTGNIHLLLEASVTEGEPYR